MFPARYFNLRNWARRFWAKVGATVVTGPGVFTLSETTPNVYTLAETSPNAFTQSETALTVFTIAETPV